MRFEGSADYVATEDLQVAVNAAVALERPLLVKGEPGTGKTVLAHEIARGLSVPLLEWHIKSTTKAHQGLYEYDAVSRLRDSQLGDPRVSDIANYMARFEVSLLATGITSERQIVELLDNDILQVQGDYIAAAGPARSDLVLEPGRASAQPLRRAEL